MTTKKNRPTIAELTAKLEAMEQALAEKQAENEALAAKVPAPRIGKKAANHEPAENGCPTARYMGAGDKPVTYQHVTPETALKIATLAYDTFGTDPFTAKALAEVMVATFKGAMGGPLYKGKDPVGSARINGFQKSNNVVRHVDEQYQPWTEVGHDRGAGLFRVNVDGLVGLKNWVKASASHARRWPMELN